MQGKETRWKKSGVENKWRFNYNGRLITAIVHHEPSFSRNSYYSCPRLREGGIVDFPADTLDTLENSSPFPRVPCTSSLRFTLGIHARTMSTLSSQSFSHDGFHSLEISHSLNTHSLPLITSNVSSLRDCLRTSLTTSKKMKHSGDFRR